MATVILVRHGRTTANAEGVLAGRTEGVRLDSVGESQAHAVAERLAGLPLARIVSSPLERCQQTAQAIAAAQAAPSPFRLEVGITECDFGDWQGGSLRELRKEPLWAVVQSHPSAAAFPGGESLPAMQARAVEAVRRHNREIEELHGADAVWVAVSHGDIIKSVLADALGVHLDLFQRLMVDPASASIVRYGKERPEVVAVNTSAGSLDTLSKPRSADSMVGGGAGPQESSVYAGGDAR